MKKFKELTVREQLLVAAKILAKLAEKPTPTTLDRFEDAQFESVVALLIYIKGQKITYK